MSVTALTLTTVMRMRAALTQVGVSPVLAILAILEMESPVQVSVWLCHYTGKTSSDNVQPQSLYTVYAVENTVL